MPTGQYQTAMKPKAACQKEFHPSVKRGRAILFDARNKSKPHISYAYIFDFYQSFL